MNIEMLDAYEPLKKDELKKALNLIVTQSLFSIDRFKEGFKHIFSTDNFYTPAENNQWTNGFYTGQLWLAYELSGDELFRHVAEAHVKSFRERIDNGVATDTHDLGFLYSLSCVAAYKLTGDEFARETALLAADHLLRRFHEAGQFIQAWGSLESKENYRLIIDCLLNLPLLYWASEATGNTIYREKAEAHIHTSVNVLFRPDFSAYHTFYFDPETGEPDRGETHQGYSADSAWARGQAWGVYGLALSYRYTKNPDYLTLFEGVLGYFLSHLEGDLIPYWDFIFEEGSDEERDSSALAIVVCGLLEMARYVDKEVSLRYQKLASILSKALIDHCGVASCEESDGLLLHGVYGKKTPYNDCKNHGIDECNLWGDYFYAEALVRQAGEWTPYW